MIHPVTGSVTAVSKRRASVLWARDGRNARPGAQRRNAWRTVASAASAQSTLTSTEVSRQINNTNRPRTGADSNPRRPSDVAPAPGSIPIVINAQSAARSLFAALNHRDVSAVLSLLADDVTYENLGSSAILRGRAAVGQFYLEALAALPDDAVFMLEGPGGRGTDPWDGDEPDAAAGGPILQAGVAWRVELNGAAVPLSRGVGVYWADPRTGRLSCIWDNPEHTVKQAAPALTSAAWASPLLRGLGPLVMPAARSVGNLLTGMPGSGGSGEPAGGAAGGLAGSVMSTLTSMMPFQTQGPAAAAAARASRRSSGTGGAGRESSSGSSSSGAGGGARGAIYRDHTRLPANGAGARAAVAAAAAASAASAASTAAGGAGGGGSSKAGVGGGSNGIRTSAVAVRSTSFAGAAAPSKAASAAATTTAVAPKTAAAQVAFSALPPAASTGHKGDAIARGSLGETIRMRPLPDPPPSSSPSASFASLDGDASSSSTRTTATVAGTAAAANISTARAAATTSAAAVTTTAAAAVTSGAPSAASTSGGAASKLNGSHSPSPISKPNVDQNGSKSSSSRNNNSSNNNNNSGNSRCESSSSPGSGFGSLDSGSETDGEAVAPAALPFPPSTSLAANLAGLWEKDASASEVEEYESMLDVLELGGLQKVTARLIDGLDVRQDEQRFEVGFVTVVPFFRVTEKSSFSSSTSMMRRDLRSGRQTAQAARIPGGVAVDMSWAAPLAGSLREEYRLSEDGGAMAVTSRIRIGQRAATATQVYRRSGRNKSDFLASKRSSYGSLEDVLRSQEKKYGKINY